MSNKKTTMAKLGRVCGLLESLETFPEYNGCSTIIRKARKNLQHAILELSEIECSSVYSKKVGRIIRFMVELFALLKAGWLKDYFNFCIQPLSIYSYEYRR